MGIKIGLSREPGRLRLSKSPLQVTDAGLTCEKEREKFEEESEHEI